MPVITAIRDQLTNKDRVSVFIDGEFCVGIRKRTFQAMNLNIGDDISCAQLKENEKFFWKKAYSNSWANEKIRINRIKEVIEQTDENLLVEIVGFGADTEELIKEHPDEKGVPDLNIARKDVPHPILMKVEVTGTEILRGEGYWVRPDKIEYAKNHPEEVVWIALHYSKPKELIRFIRLVPGKEYPIQQINIRGAGERMCVFQDSDEEVLTLEEFKMELNRIIT